jgi:hypothetical protein
MQQERRQAPVSRTPHIFAAVAALSELACRDRATANDNFSGKPCRLARLTLRAIVSRAVAGILLIACPATVLFHIFHTHPMPRIGSSDGDVFWSTAIIAGIVGPYRWIGAWLAAPIIFAISWVRYGSARRRALTETIWIVSNNRTLLTSYGSVAGFALAWHLDQRLQTPYSSGVGILIIAVATMVWREIIGFAPSDLFATRSSQPELALDCTSQKIVIRSFPHRKRHMATTSNDPENADQFIARLDQEIREWESHFANSRGASMLLPLLMTHARLTAKLCELSDATHPIGLRKRRILLERIQDVAIRIRAAGGTVPDARLPVTAKPAANDGSDWAATAAAANIPPFRWATAFPVISDGEATPKLIRSADGSLRLDDSVPLRVPMK